MSAENKRAERSVYGSIQSEQKRPAAQELHNATVAHADRRPPTATTLKSADVDIYLPAGGARGAAPAALRCAGL